MATAPHGWWTFESPVPYPGHIREQSTLYEAGLLSGAELAQLLAEWRRHFDRAHEKGFSLCTGKGAGKRVDGRSTRGPIFRVSL
jgi:hypothetical protein